MWITRTEISAPQDAIDVWWEKPAWREESNYEPGIGYRIGEPPFTRVFVPSGKNIEVRSPEPFYEVLDKFLGRRKSKVCKDPRIIEKVHQYYSEHYEV